MEHPSFLWRRGTCVFAGLLVAFSPVVANEPLSLDAAVRMAVARSRSLDASTAAARGAHEMAVAAAQRPDPVLRLSVDDLPVNGPDRFSLSMTKRSIALMQALPGADKRRTRGERFHREADAALRERALRMTRLQAEVALSWLERHLQEQRQQVLKAQIEQAQLLVQVLDGTLRGGRATATDVLMAREALAQLEQGFMAARADLTNARITLARFTGGPPEQPLGDTPPYQRIAHASEGGDRLLDLSDLPDLVALRAREAVARAEAQLAQQELTPDWTAEIMFSQRSAPFSNMVSIGVSVPLQWSRPQRQERELSARLARVAELEAERDEQTRERWLQVKRWQLEWKAGVERLAHLDSRRQPLAAQRVEAALAAYRGGREGVGAVLQARRDALSLALERLTLERDTAALWARLAYLYADTTTGATP